MKVAISAAAPTLEAEVNPRFGRCQYFIIADPETLEFEAASNDSAMSSGGAGISAAQMIVGKGVKVVLTGNCGPNAYQVLSSAGIQVITGVSGRIRDAIESYRSRKYQTSFAANVPDHYGMGGRQGPGVGMGMGMGHGMRRGMGGGMAMEPDVTPPAGDTQTPGNAEQELEALKTQSQTLAQQLSDIQRRINELGKKKE